MERAPEILRRVTRVVVAHVLSAGLRDYEALAHGLALVSPTPPALVGYAVEAMSVFVGPQRPFTKVGSAVSGYRRSGGVELEPIR